MIYQSSKIYAFVYSYCICLWQAYVSFQEICIKLVYHAARWLCTVALWQIRKWLTYPKRLDSTVLDNIDAEKQMYNSTDNWMLHQPNSVPVTHFCHTFESGYLKLSQFDTSSLISSRRYHQVRRLSGPFASVE